VGFHNLDLDTLSTLVVASYLGSYSRAAKRLARTPSAISLQMKRLQEEVGVLTSILLIAGALVHPSPARAQGAYAIKVDSDAVTHVRSVTVHLPDEHMASACGSSDGSIDEMIVTKDQAPGAPAEYGFLVSYSGQDWAYLGEEPMHVLAHEAELTLPADNHPRRETEDATSVSEMAGYHATPDQLRQVVAAGQVKVRVSGAKADCTFQLDSAAVAVLRTFVAREVAPASK
jgi:hypothetical protein